MKSSWTEREAGDQRSYWPKVPRGMSLHCLRSPRKDTSEQQEPVPNMDSWGPSSRDSALGAGWVCELAHLTRALGSSQGGF